MKLLNLAVAVVLSSSAFSAQMSQVEAPLLDEPTAGTVAVPVPVVAPVAAQAPVAMATRITRSASVIQNGGQYPDRIKVSSMCSTAKLANTSHETIDAFVDVVLNGQGGACKNNVKRVLNDLFDAHQSVLSFGTQALDSSNLFAGLAGNPSGNIKITMMASKISSCLNKKANEIAQKETTTYHLDSFKMVDGHLKQRAEASAEVDSFRREMGSLNAMSQVSTELVYAGALAGARADAYEEYIRDFKLFESKLSSGGVTVSSCHFEFSKDLRSLKGAKVSRDIDLRNSENSDSYSPQVRDYFNTKAGDSVAAFDQLKTDISDKKFLSCGNFVNWIGSWFVF